MNTMQNSKFALFLGDLSMHCNETDLEEAFSPYGTILEIRVKRSKETAKTLSYGFLEFASASSAVNAMNDMDGYVLKGRPLRIRWAASKKNPVRKRDIREDLSDRISMHVKFMSYKIDKVITEELLRNLFSIYGEVCDTTIKQISIDRKSHRLKGYGFVSYFNDEAGYMAAQRALTELHETSLDDVTYKCELSNIIDAPPPAVPYSPHTGGMPLSPHHQLQGMGLSSGAVQEYDFDVSQHQCSYYDDYDGNTSAETSLYQQPQTSAAGVYDTVGFPEPSPAPPIRALSTSLSSNSGFDGAPIPSSAPAIRGLAASLSTGSETFSLSLDNDIGSSPTATALEIRAPSTMQVEDVRSPYILSPSLTSAAAGGAHAQGSYQITAPSGASAGFPVARQQNNAPRSFQYGQQQQQYGAQFPTQYPAQYASQSRYQAGNRDGGIYAQQPPQQMQQHMQGGVASYNAPPQQQQQPYNPRRAVGGHSSLSAQAPYWQPPLQQQQGGPYGAPPQHQHQHNPRMAHNGYMPQQQQHQRYEQRPQYAGHSHQQQQGQYQGQQQHFNQHQQVPPQHPLQGNYAPRPHQPIYARAPPPAPSLSLSLPGEYHHSQAPSSGSPSPLPLPTGCSQLRNGQQQNLQQPGSHHSRNPSFEHSPSLPGSAPSSGNNSLSAPTSAPRTFFNDLSLVDSALGEGLGLNPAEPLGLGHGSLDSALLDGFGAGLSEI